MICSKHLELMRQELLRFALTFASARAQPDRQICAARAEVGFFLMYQSCGTWSVPPSASQ